MADREPKNPRGGQAEEAFIGKLVRDPKAPPKTTLLVGFLGRSSEEGHTRLYFDPELSDYVEIPNDAILHTEEVAEETPLGGSYVWIAHNAEVIHGEAGGARYKASFLEGRITQDFMGQAQAGMAAAEAGFGAAGAAGFGGGFPTLPTACGYTVYLCCPPTLQYYCPTRQIWCKPSLILPCPTVVHWHCPTKQIWCKPSLLLPCPTVFHWHCPTRQIWCKPSVIVQCPSVPAWQCPVTLPAGCVTHINRCPTLTAACGGLASANVIACQQTLVCPSAVDACPSAPGGCYDPGIPPHWNPGLGQAVNPAAYGGGAFGG